MKENVLIGKLIPAGSGLMAYRDYQPGATPESRLPEDFEATPKPRVDVAIAAIGIFVNSSKFIATF